ncbi:hypothetical protein AB1L88_19655 [Tautonia sp. JC769]|uniref:hypothetical protein n=1 Tax=Tautonia sp. JC769 TaxID=3232135 RepID=UPI00345A14C1
MLLPPSHAQEVVPITVEEWSIWVGSPAHERLNDRNAARNAMPQVVGTARPGQSEGRPSDFPVAPVSIIRFLGEPTADLDLELRVGSGSFLAHWPPARERVDSLRWFGTNLTPTRPDDRPPVFLSESHLFRSLRELDDSLVIEAETRAESFLSYDTELNLPIPLTLQDGPDTYTLQNVSGHPLYDLAVIVPTEGGYRIGWLDELPAGKAPEAPAAENPPPSSGADTESESDPDADADPALDLFDEAPDDITENDQAREQASGDEDAPQAPARQLPPLPAEADATVRARTEQLLNQPVVFDGSSLPIAAVLQRIRAQTGLQSNPDAQTLAEATLDLDTSSATPTPGQRAARDVLAEVLDGVGLTYRIIQDGTLFVTTKERLEADAGSQDIQVKGPPVPLELSDELPASDPGYADVSDRELVRRLVARGLDEDRARMTLDRLGPNLFRPDRLVVLAHLAREAIDEAVPLDVFPPPRQTVRIATVVISGIDPGLAEQAEQLVAQLGDPSPIARERAERDLFDLGPVSIPALNEALKHQDVEVVYRAERLLRRLDQPIP